MKKFTFPKPREKEAPPSTKRSPTPEPSIRRRPSPEPYNPAVGGRKPRAAVSLIPPKSAERAENKKEPKFQPKFPGMSKQNPQNRPKAGAVKAPVEMSSEETRALAARTLQAWCRTRLHVNNQQGNVHKEDEPRQEHDDGGVNTSGDTVVGETSGHTEAGRDEQTELSTSEPDDGSSTEARNTSEEHDKDGAQAENSAGWARDAVRKKATTTRALQKNQTPASKRGVEKEKPALQPQGSYSAHNPAHIIPSAKKVKKIIDSSPLKTKVPRNLRLYDQQRSRMLKLGGIEWEEKRQPSPDILHEEKIVEEEVDSHSVEELAASKEDGSPEIERPEQAEDEVNEVETRPANTPDAVTYPDWSPSKRSIDRALDGDRKELVEEVCRQHATREKFAVLRKAGLWQPNIDPQNPPSTVLEGVLEVLAETGLVPEVVTKEECMKLFKVQPNVDESKPVEEVGGEEEAQEQEQKQEQEQEPEQEPEQELEQKEKQHEKEEEVKDETEEEDEAEPRRSQSCEPAGSQSEDPTGERKKVSFAPREQQAHKAASKPARRHSLPDRKRRRKPAAQPAEKPDADFAVFVQLVSKIAEHLDLDKVEQLQTKRNAAAAAEWARTRTPWSSAHPHAAARPRTSVRQLMLAQDQMRLQHTQKLRLKQKQKQQYLSELSERRRKHETAWEEKEDKKRRWNEALKEVEVLVSAIRQDTFSMSPPKASSSSTSPLSHPSPNRRVHNHVQQQQRLSFMDVLDDDPSDPTVGLLLSRPQKTNSRSLARRLGFRSVEL